MQTNKRNLLTITLSCLASIVLVYTLNNIYQHYMLPFSVMQGPVYEAGASARNYRLISNLLYVISFLLPGLYLAWKNEKFRMKFLAVEIFQLLFINISLLH